MKIDRAIELCNNWHKGENTALYQYTKTGEYNKFNHLSYLLEIEMCLHPEAFDLVGPPCNNERKHLESLITYFTGMGEAAGIITSWKIKPGAGYMRPIVWPIRQTATVQRSY